MTMPWDTPAPATVAAPQPPNTADLLLMQNSLVDVTLAIAVGLGTFIHPSTLTDLAWVAVFTMAAKTLIQAAIARVWHEH